MAEPIISRRFARFLISLGSLVTSTPFLNQNDWRGWLATFVTGVALASIAWLALWAMIDRWEDFD